MDQCHREGILIPRSPAPVLLDMEPQHLDTLFLDSVSAGDIDNVRRLLGMVFDEVSNNGYIAALRYSTTAMVKLFLDFGKNIDKVPTADSCLINPMYRVPLVQAIECQNYEVANHLLSHGCHVNKRQDPVSTHKNALDTALLIDSYENKLKAVSLLIDYDVDLSQRYVEMSSLIPEDNDHNPEIIKLLEIFKVAQRENEFSKTLITIAQKNCSIEVAEHLLKNGANVDGILTSRGSYIASPLYSAVHRNTQSAFIFIKFLLESGAYPFINRGGKLPGGRRGARNLSKWLGMTWDELLESTKSARAK